MLLQYFVGFQLGMWLDSTADPDFETYVSGFGYLDSFVCFGWREEKGISLLWLFSECMSEESPSWWI